MGGTLSVSAVFGPPVAGPVVDPFAGQTPFGFEIPQGSVAGLEDEARQAGLVSLGFDFRAQDMRTAARVASGRWQGQAQTAFLDYAAHLIAVFENNSQTTGHAGRLMQTLAQELESVQQATRQAAQECEACQRQHDSQQELADQHARNASDLHQQAALAPHPHTQAELSRQAQTAEADSQTASRAAQAAQDELSSWQKRGQNAYGNYIDVAGRIGRELSALTDQLQRPSLPRGVPAGLLPISAADAKRAQTLLSKAAAIPASKWREHPGEALREINHGKGMTPNQILALYQAEKAQAGKPKGDLGDTYGGELSGIVGFHLFGNQGTSEYQTADKVAAIASMIPIDPEALTKDAGEEGAKLLEKAIAEDSAKGAFKDGGQVAREVHVDSPGPRTPFATQTDLAPDTAYHVEGRGTFYTDEHGKVTFVDTSSGKTGALNPDLLHPQPNTTYLVDGTVYHMDGLGRPDDVHAEQLTLGNADRSPSVQSRIGDQGGPGYEGGHLVANMFGGGPEDHNLVPMLQSVNRGSGSSFGNLEGHWQSLLNKNPDTKISVDINLHYGGASKVPDRMTVNYSINGVQQKPQRFMNG